MTSGKMRPKRDDLERDRLAKRTRKTLILSGKKIGKLTDSEKITPSQRKSINGRKRYARIVSNHSQNRPNPDCWVCPRKPGCGLTPEDPGCTATTAKEPCPVCRQIYLHYASHDSGRWICPVCRLSQGDTHA